MHICVYTCMHTCLSTCVEHVPRTVGKLSAEAVITSVPAHLYPERCAWRRRCRNQWMRGSCSVTPYSGPSKRRGHRLNCDLGIADGSSNAQGIDVAVLTMSVVDGSTGGFQQYIAHAEVYFRCLSALRGCTPARPSLYRP